MYAIRSYYGKIYNYIGTLRKSQQNLAPVNSVDVDRSRQVAAFRANLPDLHPGITELQDQETRVATIEEPQSVAPLLDVMEWPRVAVHSYNFV